jgi:peptide/nickel transport system permease protein
MLIYLFALELKWLPVMGYTSPFDDFWLSTKKIIMPVACLAIWPLAGNVRLVRSTMLEVLRQDYIRTAWSKGLRERVVISRHALRNGLIPVVTMAGMWVATIVGGAVLIEQVFNIPGMGRLAVDAIFTQDYAYVQGVTLIIAVAVALTNLLVDISYGWIDPRIRYS